MAQLIDIINSGAFKLPTTENTSSAGNLWFDEDSQRVYYSYDDGGAIEVRVLGSS